VERRRFGVLEKERDIADAQAVLPRSGPQRARPDWSLLEIPHIEELTAIPWRLQNLRELARRSPGVTPTPRALGCSVDVQETNGPEDRVGPQSDVTYL
jgi:hypothetical protein